MSELTLPLAIICFATFAILLLNDLRLEVDEFDEDDPSEADAPDSEEAYVSLLVAKSFSRNLRYPR